MIIPGLVSVTFRDRTAEWIIKQCQRAGLKAVEWSENIHVFPDDEAGADHLYRQTTAAGLSVAAYGSYYRLGEQEAPAEVFGRSLRSAAALRAPVIRIWAGTKPSLEVGEAEFDRLAEEAVLIAELAQKEGVKCALEWHRNTLTDTNETAMKLLHKADHPNLYCLWQPTVALSMAERIEGLRFLAERGRLLNLHMYYWRGEIRRPLEEGVSEWQQYLSVIDPQEDRYGLMEFVMDGTEEQFLADAGILHRLLEL